MRGFILFLIAAPLAAASSDTKYFSVSVQGYVGSSDEPIAVEDFTMSTREAKRSFFIGTDKSVRSDSWVDPVVKDVSQVAIVTNYDLVDGKLECRVETATERVGQSWVADLHPILLKNDGKREAWPDGETKPVFVATCNYLKYRNMPDFTVTISAETSYGTPVKHTFAVTSTQISKAWGFNLYIAAKEPPFGNIGLLDDRVSNFIMTTEPEVMDIHCAIGGTLDNMFYAVFLNKVGKKESWHEGRYIQPKHIYCNLQ